MTDQVNEDGEDAVLSHEADIEAGFDDDNDGDSATDGLVAGSGLPVDTAPPTSHEADIDAGFDDAESQVADNDR